MKVGTDAVLLGAWAAPTGKYRNILDIGCGSGLISIMAAQRFRNARITGIDIHRASVDQSRENTLATPWAKRMEMLHSSLQEFGSAGKNEFDLIISNPPFFSHSLLPPDQLRINAKHTEKLSYADLARCSSKLMSEKGLLALILPYEMQEEFDREARRNQLYLSRRMDIIPIEGKAANRVVSEWSKFPCTPQSAGICIRNAKKEYTEEYKKLTAEFYLAH